jgi:hypothetical protein
LESVDLTVTCISSFPSPVRLNPHFSIIIPGSAFTVRLVVTFTSPRNSSSHNCMSLPTHVSSSVSMILPGRKAYLFLVLL